MTDTLHPARPIVTRASLIARHTLPAALVGAGRSRRVSGGARLHAGHRGEQRGAAGLGDALADGAARTARPRTSTS